MRRFPVGWAIFAFAVVMLVAGVLLYGPSEFARWREVIHVGKAPSALYARLVIRYDTPPIYEEVWSMQDVNGISSYSYRVRSYAGKEIIVGMPPGRVYDVSFFFGKLVQDGVWDLRSTPPVGNTRIHYTVFVKQVVDYKQGERTITFTDPHWWAVTAARSYRIHLSPNAPVPDLLMLKGRPMRDVRYQEIVDDFRSFGPAQFRAAVAQARAEIAGHSAEHAR
jgi:hypothetical protein